MHICKDTLNILMLAILLLLCTQSFAQIPTESSTNNFTFLINSDPQMGEQNIQSKRLKTLNDLLDSFVQEVNAQITKPEFVVWNGDLVWKPNEGSFKNFERIIKPMQSNSILVHGNHDGTLGDENFYRLQKNIMSFSQLNYSFDYGQWHFVVIGSQEKYPTKKLKQELINWLKNDLNKSKKPTMLFMHYHLLPVGLSQMEFYSFTPNTFRNQLLETMTTQGQVKYVFSGHVHVGIKPSIKTMRQYKDTVFILPPSSVPGRPFGEEFSYYDQPGDPFDDKGYYLEVKVKGHDVSFFGHKIKHPKITQYPLNDIKPFDKNMDIRAFINEAELPANPTLVNGDFSNGLTGWQSSWRYQTDNNPAYINSVVSNSNLISYKSKYGYWAQDEYLENFQVIKYPNNSQLSVNFELPEDYKGGGGYFRVFGYDKNNKLKDMALFHWGDDEHKIKYMHQSWAYNVTGTRKHPFWLNQKIRTNKLNSYILSPATKQTNNLIIKLDQVLNGAKDIVKIGVAYGVWGRVNSNGTAFNSTLKINQIILDDAELDQVSVSFNNLEIKSKDKILHYGKVYEQIIKQKIR